MYDIAHNKKKRIGRCELCGKPDNHLERHHITYVPERTRNLCHNCHFTAHFKPERLPDVSKVLLLNKVMSIKDAVSFVKENGKDRVKLARAFAPSRRKAIRDEQKKYKGVKK